MFYSNDLLCNCKELVRERVVNSCLNISCDEIVKRIHEPIDIDKFDAWLQFNLDKFKSKSNQTSYFTKAFINELEKGTFKLVKVEYLPKIQELITAIRDKNIVLLADDTGYLNVMWEELINYYGISVDSAKILNRQILDYIDSETSFEDYKKLLKRSNTLKPYKIDWKAIERKANEFNQKWNKVLDEMESVYD